MERRAEGSGTRSLGDARQAAIDALCEHFANDAIPLEEFERRIEVAHRAGSVDELAGLLRDLPEGKVPALRRESASATPARMPPTLPAAHETEQAFVMAVMGGATRRGRWTPARTTYAFALMGGAELDFREAVLPRGVTHVHALAIMGGVEIIVPPGVNVESHGIGILGGFEDAGEESHDPGSPTLRVAGMAVMGGVEITVRYPGESGRDARVRRREEARERRRARGSKE